MYNINTASNVIQFPNLRPENEISVAMPVSHQKAVCGAAISGQNVPFCGIKRGDAVIYSSNTSGATPDSVYVVHAQGEALLKRITRKGKKLILWTTTERTGEEFHESEVEIKGVIFAIQRPLEF